LFLLLKQNKETFTQKNSLKERENLHKSFDSSDMMYLLMPDRFANGNNNNDSENNTKKNNRDLPGGRHGGDIEGIIKKIRLFRP
jgi:hypothetical protein